MGWLGSASTKTLAPGGAAALQPTWASEASTTPSTPEAPPLCSFRKGEKPSNGAHACWPFQQVRAENHLPPATWLRNLEPLWEAHLWPAELGLPPLWAMSYVYVNIV